MSRFNSISLAARSALCIAAVAGLGTAQAAVTAYTTTTSFNAAVQQPFTDSFDSLDFDFAASPLVRNNGPYNYSVTTAGGFYGAGTMGGDIWLSTNLSGASMTFGNFSSTVRGLGGLFFGSDVAGAFLPGQVLTLTALDSLGATSTLTLNNATITSFAGFVTNAALVSVTVSIDANGSWATANNLVLATAVPEPGAWALMLAGLATVAQLSRRRRA